MQGIVTRNFSWNCLTRMDFVSGFSLLVIFEKYSGLFLYFTENKKTGDRDFLITGQCISKKQ